MGNTLTERMRWNCAWWAVRVIEVNKPRSKIYHMALVVLLDYFKEVKDERL